MFQRLDAEIEPRKRMSPFDFDRLRDLRVGQAFGPVASYLSNLDPSPGAPSPRQPSG
jgi:hypothetical protein